jgi:hypothetical protein
LQIKVLSGENVQFRRKESNGFRGYSAANQRIMHKNMLEKLRIPGFSGPVGVYQERGIVACPVTGNQRSIFFYQAMDFLHGAQRIVYAMGSVALK